MAELDREENHVAVIGLACRFPGEATDAGSFWSLLCKARSAYSSSDRFKLSAFQSKATEKSEMRMPTGAHFLRDDVAAFDANFFGISANEAKAMDPQQRIMLEIAYEAFENAALSIEAIAGTNTSCYVGNFTTDYKDMLFRDPESNSLRTISGIGAELIANRISWFYDLRGSSVTVNTACSSSLVAFHHGYQSLRTKESSMALIGGSNLLLNPDYFQAMSKQHFLARDGLSKSFDAKGDGYGRGEGFAAVILKRFNDAIRDGDPIRAVIRGSGVNQDGKTKGITVPSLESQADLIRSTYRSAGLDFKDTHYCEAHGTGTKVGDPIELEAISKTLGAARDQGDTITVGSLKPNIGHLEATAGLASIIKGIYILENAVIPPNIYFEESNPRIPLERWNIKIPVETIPWPVRGLRRVSVQSFGYGGTNAHVILDDAYHYLKDRGFNTHHCTKSTLSPNACESSTEAGKKIQTENGLRKAIYQPVLRLLIFSAQDQHGVNRQREPLLQSIRNHSAESAKLAKSSRSEISYIRDLAFTLSERRSRLAWKTFLIASSTSDLCSALNNAATHTTTFRSSHEPRLGFIFSGQGAQWARMGVELSEYLVFWESVRASEEYLCSALDCPWSVIEEMNREQDESKINLPVYCQPICTVLQLALIDLLESWAISPSAVIGHSSGEIAAAYCVGSLSKQDALKIAYYQGLLSSELTRASPQLLGAMMAVEASEARVQEWIDRLCPGEVVVACVNSPSSVTISGDVSSVEEMQRILALEGVFTKRLEVAAAYHSPHMNRISAPYLEAIKDVQARDSHSGRQLFSSVTGCIVHPSELGPMSWVRNLLAPVFFYDAFHSLLRPVQDGLRSMDNNVDFLIEIGPHSALKSPVRKIMTQHGITGVEYQSVLSRGCNAIQTALTMAGKLFVHGVKVDIGQINQYASDDFSEPPLPLLDLPAYSWDHSHKFWAESRICKEYRHRQHPHLNLLGAPCPSFGAGEMLWRGLWRVCEESWIQDHVVQRSILYPAAGYIAMAVEAASQVAAKDRVIRNFRLRDIQLMTPTTLTEESEVEVILQLRPSLTGARDSIPLWAEFKVSSSTGGSELRQSCCGSILTEYIFTEDAKTVSEQSLEDESYRKEYTHNEKTCRRPENPKSFYEELAALGIIYGPTLRNITQISLGSGKSRCTVDIPGSTTLGSFNGNQRPHVIHPATLDGIFHFVFAAFKDQNGRLNEALVPKSIDEMSISANIAFKPGGRLRGICDASKHGRREVRSQIVVFDEALKNSVLSVKGFCWAIIDAPNPSQENGNMPIARRLFSKLIWQPAPQLLERDSQICHYTILEASNTTPLSQAVATQLENLLNGESLTTNRMTWTHKAFDLGNQHYISLMELENVFLHDMATEDFAKLKQCILASSSLLWVTAVDDPNGDIVLGLARTIRNEIPGKCFRTLRLQSSSPSPSRLAETIMKIATTSTPETEYIEEEGILKVCRVVEDIAMIGDMSHWMKEAGDDTGRPSTKQACRPQRLAIITPGILDALCLENDDILQNNLGDNEVEIKVMATGLNFRDVMAAMGQVPDDLLGFDASGTIVRAGKDVTRFKIGDAVCSLGHGTHRSLVRNKADFCQPLPSNLSFEEAATLPLVHCTAFYALVYIARVRQGQSILIHAAAGGVGQAAIQIAIHFGLEIFATVGSTEKRQLIQDVYGIAEDHIFNTRDLSFARGILRMTNNRGVDCVLNSLSGQALQETWRCIAPFGAFVEIGIKDIMVNARLEMRPFLQDASFTFFNLQHIMTKRPELMKEILENAFDFLRRGITKPVSPIVTYPISEVECAFRLMQTGKHKGKIAVDWSSRHASVKAEVLEPSRLDPNASYLLVGGLGGLGRSLAHLLVSLGARSLCFISRSGDHSSQARSLIQSLNKIGVQTKVYRCNIANAELLAETLLQCSQDMQPIKGVFQCAMALHDTLFERMTYQQWIDGLNPKVQGSWNLHTILPKDLDFHITLSSFIGLFGNRSQANYAAGGTYQDSLAFHRRSLGLKAITVDLGIMRDVGGLAERGSTGYIREWEESFGIREYELHGMMKRLISSEVENSGEMPPQIITGFATGGSAQAAGIQRPYYFDDPRFSILAQTGLSKEGQDFSVNGPHKKAVLCEQLALAKTLPDAARAVTEAMVGRIAKSLQTDVSEIDEHRPLYTYGIDSLVAVEISDWIFKQTNVVTSVFDVLATRPICKFALDLASMSQFVRDELKSL